MVINRMGQPGPVNTTHNWEMNLFPQANSAGPGGAMMYDLLSGKQREADTAAGSSLSAEYTPPTGVPRPPSDRDRQTPTAPGEPAV
ncbi:hypothetical protein AAFF_G00206600 [Aldrovandia affinis]|uniref:Uncharacterized protein n=1 Tax=Aldrovandia affinis TaxID=143900 RepID=A0AAD7RHK9_9TELE|nr:hypothetical protein AAFF_G00206600 [Aldrovandia affinis]